MSMKRQDIMYNTHVDFNLRTGRFLFRKYYKSIDEAFDVARATIYLTQVYSAGILVETFSARPEKIEEFIEISPGLWTKNKEGLSKTELHYIKEEQRTAEACKRLDVIYCTKL